MNATDETDGKSRVKVLVIEDDTLTRLTLCNLLRKMDYSTVEACNGYTGLMAFRREVPDIIITDIIMPEQEGLETIAEMRAANPNVKIIAMSGGGTRRNANYLDLARQLGATETINKPFRPNDILSVLNSLQ